MPTVSDAGKQQRHHFPASLSCEGSMDHNGSHSSCSSISNSNRSSQHEHRCHYQRSMESPAGGERFACRIVATLTPFENIESRVSSAWGSASASASANVPSDFVLEPPLPVQDFEQLCNSRAEFESFTLRVGSEWNDNITGSNNNNNNNDTNTNNNNNNSSALAGDSSLHRKPNDIIVPLPGLTPNFLEFGLTLERDVDGVARPHLVARSLPHIKQHVASPCSPSTARRKLNFEKSNQGEQIVGGSCSRHVRPKPSAAHTARGGCFYYLQHRRGGLHSKFAESCSAVRPEAPAPPSASTSFPPSFQQQQQHQQQQQQQPQARARARAPRQSQGPEEPSPGWAPLLSGCSVTLGQRATFLIEAADDTMFHPDNEEEAEEEEEEDPCQSDKLHSSCWRQHRQSHAQSHSRSRSPCIGGARISKALRADLQLNPHSSNDFPNSPSRSFGVGRSRKLGRSAILKVEVLPCRKPPVLKPVAAGNEGRGFTDLVPRQDQLGGLVGGRTSILDSFVVDDDDEEEETEESLRERGAAAEAARRHDKPAFRRSGRSSRAMLDRSSAGQDQVARAQALLRGTAAVESSKTLLSELERMARARSSAVRIEQCVNSIPMQSVLMVITLIYCSGYLLTVPAENANFSDWVIVMNSLVAFLNISELVICMASQVGWQFWNYFWPLFHKMQVCWLIATLLCGAESTIVRLSIESEAIDWLASDTDRYRITVAVMVTYRLLRAWGIYFKVSVQATLRARQRRETDAVVGVWADEYRRQRRDYDQRLSVRLQAIADSYWAQTTIIIVVLLYCAIYSMTISWDLARSKFGIIQNLDVVVKPTGYFLLIVFLLEFMLRCWAQEGERFFSPIWHKFEIFVLILCLLTLGYSSWYTERIRASESWIEPQGTSTAFLLLLHRVLRVIGLRLQVSASGGSATSVLGASVMEWIRQNCGDLLDIPPGNVVLSRDHGIVFEIRKAMVKPGALKGLHLPMQLKGLYLEELFVHLPQLSALVGSLVARKRSPSKKESLSIVRINGLVILMEPGPGLWPPTPSSAEADRQGSPELNAERVPSGGGVHGRLTRVLSGTAIPSWSHTSKGRPPDHGPPVSNHNTTATGVTSMSTAGATSRAGSSSGGEMDGEDSYNKYWSYKRLLESQNRVVALICKQFPWALSVPDDKAKPIVDKCLSQWRAEIRCIRVEYNDPRSGLKPEEGGPSGVQLTLGSCTAKWVAGDSATCDLTRLSVSVETGRLGSPKLWDEVPRKVMQCARREDLVQCFRWWAISIASSQSGSQGLRRRHRRSEMWRPEQLGLSLQDDDYPDTGGRPPAGTAFSEQTNSTGRPRGMSYETCTTFASALGTTSTAWLSAPCTPDGERRWRCSSGGGGSILSLLRLRLRAKVGLVLTSDALVDEGQGDSEARLDKDFVACSQSAGIFWRVQAQPVSIAIEEAQLFAARRLALALKTWFLNDHAFRWRPAISPSDPSCTPQERRALARLWWLYATQRILATSRDWSWRPAWMRGSWLSACQQQYKTLLRTIKARRSKIAAWEEEWLKELQLQLGLARAIKARATVFVEGLPKPKKPPPPPPDILEVLGGLWHAYIPSLEVRLLHAPFCSEPTTRALLLGLSLHRIAIDAEVPMPGSNKCLASTLTVDDLLAVSPETSGLTGTIDGNILRVAKYLRHSVAQVTAPLLAGSRISQDVSVILRTARRLDNIGVIELHTADLAIILPEPLMARIVELVLALVDPAADDPSAATTSTIVSTAPAAAATAAAAAAAGHSVGSARARSASASGSMGAAPSTGSNTSGKSAKSTTRFGGGPAGAAGPLARSTSALSQSDRVRVAHGRVLGLFAEVTLEDSMLLGLDATDLRFLLEKRRRALAKKRAEAALLEGEARLFETLVSNEVLAGWELTMNLGGLRCSQLGDYTALTKLAEDFTLGPLQAIATRKAGDQSITLSQDWGRVNGAALASKSMPMFMHGTDTGYLLRSSQRKLFSASPNRRSLDQRSLPVERAGEQQQQQQSSSSSNNNNSRAATRSQGGGLGLGAEPTHELLLDFADEAATDEKIVSPSNLQDRSGTQEPSTHAARFARSGATKSPDYPSRPEASGGLDPRSLLCGPQLIFPGVADCCHSACYDSYGGGREATLGTRSAARAATHSAVTWAGRNGVGNNALANQNGQTTLSVSAHVLSHKELAQLLGQDQ